jgi:translation initiation factor 3 subunit K
MGIAFDFTAERPPHIDAVLNGLDRYNPESTQIFEEYVTQQCENRTHDIYANLALLKL